MGCLGVGLIIFGIVGIIAAFGVAESVGEALLAVLVLGILPILAGVGLFVLQNKIENKGYENAEKRFNEDLTKKFKEKGGKCLQCGSTDVTCEADKSSWPVVYTRWICNNCNYVDDWLKNTY